MRETVSRRGTRNGNGESAIQSVARAAQILGFFTVGRPRRSLSEITARLGVSKATAHRYTVALRQANLLRFDPATGEYTLGPQVLTLAGAAGAGLPVVAIAGPHMEALVHRVNETAVLSVWDGEAPVVVRVDDNPDRLVRISIHTGSRLTLFGSSQGRVFCAFLPEDEVPGLRRALKRDAKLRSALLRVRKERLAITSDVEPGIRAVAAPVFSGDRIMATVAVVGTIAAIPEQGSSPVARAVMATAGQLSHEFGTVEAQRELAV
ncbi:MAG: IclR family transcriptional regulator [Chloroflexi bacterium]|nr:IclR family transcriptional regulator [Chloroflexota bacterium]